MVESVTAVVAYVVDREAVQGGTVRCRDTGRGESWGKDMQVRRVKSGVGVEFT